MWPRPAARRRRPGPPSASAGLELTYPGRRVPALDGADLVVAPGETVAITGPSGCGKSTLLSVILGLRVPDAGSVSLGGVDLADLDLDDWRSQIGWVPQRPHLFARSVAENVRLGRPDASDAAVAAALEAAGLTEVVRRLPHGADTMLGEGGAGLSAGERQRVSLARAFVRDAPLLLLDEPTASLDGQTEADVLEAVRRLVSGRTAVIVAHRPALAALADRVVELPAPIGGGVVSDDRAGIARTLGIARSARRRLAEASLLGAGAIGASIALMGTSAWLISRAAQRPSEASLTLAIVGRAVLRPLAGVLPLRRAAGRPRCRAARARRPAGARVRAARGGGSRRPPRLPPG